MIARYGLPEAQVHLLSMSSGTIYRCNDGEQRFLLVFFHSKLHLLSSQGFVKTLNPFFGKMCPRVQFFSPPSRKRTKKLSSRDVKLSEYKSGKQYKCLIKLTNGSLQICVSWSLIKFTNDLFCRFQSVTHRPLIEMTNKCLICHRSKKKTCLV